MTLRGHVKNGGVILDTPVELPDGTDVEVDLRPMTDQGPTFYERYRQIIGTTEGLPADFSVEHDYYIHGTLKRSEPCPAGCAHRHGSQARPAQ